MEEQNIKIKFDTNAKEATVETVKLGDSLERVTKEMPKQEDATENNTKAYTNFKTQLREANAELQKSIQMYGETSAETVKAAKSVAELKDQMGFAKDLSEQFNPDQKFKALGAATAVAGTGLTGVTAGMALFGDQSKDTQAQLLKVQAAMAFSEALSNLSNIGDQYNILKATVKNAWLGITTAKAVDTVATEANTVAENQSFLAKTKSTIATGAMSVATGVATGVQWLWNTAIMANPLVALAVALAAAAAGVYYLTKAFMASSAEAKASERANDQLNKSIANQERAFAKSSKAMEYAHELTLGMAKASGKSADEIRRLETALLNQEIAEKRLNAVKQQSIFIEARRVAGLEDATDAQKETAKKSYEAFKTANELYNNGLDARHKMTISHSIDERKEETDAHEKSLQALKDANEKIAKEKKDAREKARKDKEDEAKRIAKEKEDLDKSIADRERDKTKEVQDQQDVTEQEKLDRRKQRDLDEIEALKAKGGDVAQLMVIHDRMFEDLQYELDKKNADKKLADKLAFDEQYYLGITEYKNAKNEEELEALYNHKLALLQVEEEAKLLEIENNGGLTREEKDEQEAQVRAYYDQKEIDEKTAKEEKLLAIQDKVRARMKTNADKLLGDLAKGAIKNKAIQKAAIITEGAIGVGKAIKNTAQAVTEDLKLGMPASIPAIALDIAVGASSLATIISGTNQSLQAVGGGSVGGGGGASMPSIPTAPTQESPTVAFNNTAENQIGQSIATAQAQQPPIRVYVAEGDITNAQNSVKTVVDKNSF